jgi:hypothetical protein
MRERERETGTESETGRSPEKTRSEAVFSVEPENRRTQEDPKPRRLDPPTRPRGAILAGPSGNFQPISSGSTSVEQGTRFPAIRVHFPVKSEMISDGFLRNSLGNLL